MFRDTLEAKENTTERKDEASERDPSCSICGLPAKKNPRVMCLPCVRRAVMDVRLRWEENALKRK